MLCLLSPLYHGIHKVCRAASLAACHLLQAYCCRLVPQAERCRRTAGCATRLSLLSCAAATGMLHASGAIEGQAGELNQNANDSLQQKPSSLQAYKDRSLDKMGGLMPRLLIYWVYHESADRHQLWVKHSKTFWMSVNPLSGRMVTSLIKRDTCMSVCCVSHRPATDGTWSLLSRQGRSEPNHLQTSHR